METKVYKSLGLEVKLSVPSTVEEFDLNAKKSGSCLTEAINNCIYRGGLATFRDVFLHGQAASEATATTPATKEIVGFEKLSGIARETEPVLDKEKKPVMKDGEPVTTYSESEGKYFSRAVAKLVTDGKFANEDAVIAHYQSLADEVAAAIPFDASASESKAKGPVKLPAKYKLAAAKVLATGNLDHVNTNVLSKIGKSYVATGDTSSMFAGSYDDAGKTVPFNVSEKDASALGWLLKAYFDWKNAQDLVSL